MEEVVRIFRAGFWVPEEKFSHFLELVEDIKSTAKFCRY